jgi:hypothetical protein
MYEELKPRCGNWQDVGYKENSFASGKNTCMGSGVIY